MAYSSPPGPEQMSVTIYRVGCDDSEEYFYVLARHLADALRVFAKVYGDKLERMNHIVEHAKLDLIDPKLLGEILRVSADDPLTEP